MNDVICSVLGILFSLIFLLMSFTLPSEIRNYPVILLFFLLIFSIVIGVKGIRKRLVSKKESGDGPRILPKKVMIGLIIFACYIPSINILGYILSSVLFVFLWTTLLGNFSITKRLILSAVCVIFLVTIFGNFLGVPLPESIIIQSLL